MKWYVIGGEGNLGTSLCKLSTRTLPVRPLSKTDIDVTSPAEDIESSLREFVRPFGIVNLAAATDVSRCETDREYASSLNDDGARRVAEACDAVGVPLIHISTDYVFGGSTAPYGVDSEPCPINNYGKTKLRGEKHVLRLGGIVARMSFLPDPPGYVWVASDVLCTKEWVDKAASRLYSFLGSRDIVPGIYHLVPSFPTTLRDLVSERYPNLPEKSEADVRHVLPYRLPMDVRLSDSWVPPYDDSRRVVGRPSLEVVRG